MNAQKSETPAGATTGAKSENLATPILAGRAASVQPKGWRLVSAEITEDGGRLVFRVASGDSERVLSLGAGELAALGRNGSPRWDGAISAPGAVS